MHLNVSKDFHMTFHINYYMKVKHYDQIILNYETLPISKSPNLLVK